MNELEQLAEGTHADLQDKPKKTAPKEVNGATDDFKENGVGALGNNSMDTLTDPSLASTSAATLHDVQMMSGAKPQTANRETLKEQQISQKVNQDLFYQMPDEDNQELDSPQPTKDTKMPMEPVEPIDPIPNMGTPIKIINPDKVVEKEDSKEDKEDKQDLFENIDNNSP